MSQTYESFRRLVLDCLPPAPLEDVQSAARHSLASTRLTVLKPLIDGVDDPEAFVRGEINLRAVVGMLSSLSDMEDEGCQLTLTFVRPGQVDHLPSSLDSYNSLYTELMTELSDRLYERLEQELGFNGMNEFLAGLLDIYGAMDFERLSYSYHKFMAHVDEEVFLEAFMGSYTTVLTYVAAVILEDDETVKKLAPILRQLPMCLPLGTLLSDPQQWFILRPGTADDDD